jgi:hypothetical protein
MDEFEITAELNKIHAIHHSLDENNILTYIIFAASFESRLSPQQHEWIENRIVTLKLQTNNKLSSCFDKLDEALMVAPLLDKIIN